MKFHVNDSCIGCGLCNATCPEVFELNGARAEAMKGEVPENLLDAAREAQAGCPVSAIESD